VVERNVVHPDSRAIEVARRQHGAISAEQLAAAGLSARRVEHRVGRGLLTRLYRGVYLVGPLETEHSRLMAAVLAGGPGAVVSHYLAAVLWAVRPPREGPIDVTVPGRKVRPRPGLSTHRTTLHPHDITRRHGIPVTTAARTILDLAATEPATEAERALNEARILRLVSDPSLDEQFSRYPRHRGTAALRAITEADKGFTRSRAERITLALIRKARLPRPETNVKLAGHEVDLLWRAQRLIVEFDGYAAHSMRRSFEQDRRRDQLLVADGWRVIRITWRQLTNEPESIAATLGAALRGPG
jgi:very-short-patch-repair endonuclease